MSRAPLLALESVIFARSGLNDCMSLLYAAGDFLRDDPVNEDAAEVDRVLGLTRALSGELDTLRDRLARKKKPA